MATKHISLVTDALLSTTTVNANTGTKQNLYTVPTGKSCVITKVVVRSASASLGDIGAGLSFGFNAGANDVTNIGIDGLSGLVNATKATGATTMFSDGATGIATTVGAAAAVLGCIFADTSVTATAVVDVFGYVF